MSAAPPSRATKPPTSTVRRHRLVQRPEQPGIRQRMYDIIFEADCPQGRAFDIGLLIAIVASIMLVSIETLPGYLIEPVAVTATPAIAAEAPAAQAHAKEAQVTQTPATLTWLIAGEWFLTILFTIEYGLRLACVRHPMRYAKSFWGVVDLLSILPSYLGFFIGTSARSFTILRSIRLLRVFRILKLWRMMSQADELTDAVWRSRDKIIVFLSVVLVAVTISGTLMYHIEYVMAENPGESDFTSIPQSMYWAIVTMTTVGYGDVVPHTTIGKMISAVLILLGYSLIIVPSGFVSAELSGLRLGGHVDQHPCPNCSVSRHRSDAAYCYRCGTHLENPEA